jgi:transcriptional regulator with PAS, ATPase and Fis domain
MISLYNIIFISHASKFYYTFIHIIDMVFSIINKWSKEMDQNSKIRDLRLAKEQRLKRSEAKNEMRRIEKLEKLINNLREMSSEGPIKSEEILKLKIEIFRKLEVMPNDNPEVRLNEIGFSEDEINILMDKKTRDEVINAYFIIYKVGLYSWFSEDLSVFNLLKKNWLNNPDYMCDEIKDSIPFGTMIENKTKILIRYAKSKSHLLIIGESGTGKELIANVIHKLSDRNGKPFKKINATGLTETLFESELFGYEKGAFTGAIKKKEGLIQEASNGIFFLDELGKMPKSFQAKLLRVIENQEVRKIGSANDEKIDVRFIAALQQEELKDVLPDLLGRLKYPDALRLPSLNAIAKEDYVINIFNALFKVKSELLQGQVARLYWDTDFLNFLLKHDYKSNYRELENILHHAIMNRDPLQMNRLSLSCVKELLSDKFFCPQIQDTEKLETISLDKTYPNPTMELSKAITEENIFEPIFIEKDSVTIKLDYENIKPDGIFSIIEKVGSLIAKGMVIHIHRNIGNFNKAISKESTKSNYTEYLRKLKDIIGMRATNFIKKYEKENPEEILNIES